MLPALDAGGVERGTLELGRYLVDQGHRSIVISSAGRMTEQLIAEGSEHFNWDVGAKRLRTLLWIKKVRALLEELRPDILHLRSRLPAWIGYRAWLKMDKNIRPKLVTTVHGPYSVSRYSAVMVKGETVIAISEMIKRYILDSYKDVTENKIKIIYRGVDVNSYTPNYECPSEWLQQWQIDFPQLVNQLVLCFPARITRWKGQEHFLKVVALVKEAGIPVQGIIVGEPHQKKLHFLDELEQKVKQLGITKQISFLGHRTDIKQIMSVSDIVLSLPLDPEAFGRTTIEALSLGVPVIGYNHGGVAEQLSKLLPAGKIEKNDILSVAKLVETWYKQKPAIDANTTFTLDNMLQTTLSVYNKLIVND